MPTSLESFAESLEKLIAKFEGDKTHYLSTNYSEAQARIDFIAPFFKALGWDVENEAGLPHHAREVLVKREITPTDREIDDLVYDLYGITDKGRTIIESQQARNLEFHEVKG